jgi:hypothetical protein
VDAQWYAGDRSSETVVARECVPVAPDRGLSEFGATVRIRCSLRSNKGVPCCWQGISDRTKSESKRAPVARGG